MALGGDWFARNALTVGSKWHPINSRIDAVKVYWPEIGHKIESTPPIECKCKDINRAINAERAN